MLRLPENQATSPPLRECVIHIGTHKTATTAMQQALRSNEHAFETLGVYFPTAGRVQTDVTIAHHNIAWELLGTDPFDPERGTLASLIAELSQDQPRLVCISSEEFVFLSAFPMALERLRDELHRVGYQVRIVIYLRPQVDYFECIFGESAKHGPVRPCGALIDEVLYFRRANFWRDGGGHITEFSYSALLHPFEHVFGVRNIDVRAYRKPSNRSVLITDFISTVTRQRGPLVNGLQTAVSSNVGLRFSDLLKALITTYKGTKYELSESHGIDASALKVIIDRVDPRQPLELLGLIEIARFIRSFLLSNLYLLFRYRVFVGCVSRQRLMTALGGIFHHAGNLERRWILMLIEAYIDEVTSEPQRVAHAPNSTRAAKG